MFVKFREWNCTIKASYYSNDRKAIQLWNPDDGPIATASVNIVDLDCPDDQVWIKNYAENEGMEESLIKAGIIDPEPLLEADSAFVTVRRFKLTQEALLLWQ